MSQNIMMQVYTTDRKSYVIPPKERGADLGTQARNIARDGVTVSQGDEGGFVFIPARSVSRVEVMPTPDR
jgi:hypothetical protein